MPFLTNPLRALVFSLLVLSSTACAELKLTVKSPEDETRYSSSDAVLVSGSVENLGDGLIEVQGQKIPVNDDQFQTRMKLAPGKHNLVIKALKGDEVLKEERAVFILPNAPKLTLKSPAQLYTKTGQIKLSGEVKSSSESITLQLTGFPPSSIKPGPFKKSFQCKPRSQKLDMNAEDSFNQKSPKIELRVIYDPEAPKIKRITPLNKSLSVGATLFKGHPPLEFQIEDAHLDKVLINEEITKPVKNRYVISKGPLNKAGTITLKAIDKAGNVTTQSYVVLSEGEQKKLLSKTLKSLQEREAWAKESNPDKERALKDIEGRMNGEFQFLGLKRFSCQGLSNEIGQFRHKKTGVVFHLIPGGKFQMGSTLRPDEQPIKTVTIPAFFLAQRELSEDEWSRLQSPKNEIKSALPKGNLSWLEAKQWLDKASLRFPSEAEWEYACRSGSQSKYYWGDKDNGEWSWSAANSQGKSQEARRHSSKANAFGLIDSLGNLWEFCADDYLDSYQNHSGRASPQISSSKLPYNDKAVVGRGGSYKSPRDESRSAFRGLAKRDLKAIDHGLRPAISLP
ncbi:MAG: formylglycine-generating enzyme family protein [Planctomycetota bacterium]|nr:formylglycine-generating enzyme family protein [Planctomycetota bacterium]